MSIELVLIPIAIAITGAIRNRRRTEAMPLESHVIETRFRDPVILHEALELYGCKSISNGVDLNAEYQGTSIVFESNDTGVFEAVFTGPIPEGQSLTFIADLETEYVRLVQQQVYERLITRAKERGFVLQLEEVQEDNSVVLTFAI